MRLLILLLTLTVLAEPAAAQPLIRVRDFVAGDLAAGDSVLPDGSRYDTYRFRAEPGRVYYLYLFAEFEGRLDVGSRLRPGCGAGCLRAEDDGEPGSTVSMQFIPDRPGTHLVRVAASRGGEAGRYQLTLESQEVPEEVADSLWQGADTLGLPVDSLPDPAIYGTPVGTVITTTTMDTTMNMDSVVVGFLFYGQRAYDTLGDADYDRDGRYFDQFYFHGRAGETVVVSLRSPDFHVSLSLARSSRAEEVIAHDGGARSRGKITLTLPEKGEYVIRVTSWTPGETGAYVLTLDRRR